MENKVTAIFGSEGQGFLLWDDDQSLVIGVISNGGKTSDDAVDITAKIIDMVEDEFNAEEVKVLTNIHIEGFEDKVSIEVNTLEDGEECSRNLCITRTGIY